MPVLGDELRVAFQTIIIGFANIALCVVPRVQLPQPTKSRDRVASHTQAHLLQFLTREAETLRGEGSRGGRDLSLQRILVVEAEGFDRGQTRRVSYACCQVIVPGGCSGAETAMRPQILVGLHRSVLLVVRLREKLCIFEVLLGDAPRGRGEPLVVERESRRQRARGRTELSPLLGKHHGDVCVAVLRALLLAPQAEPAPRLPL
mmetsp:Transcript_142518/g.455577  ORF Transcript_142518/g.455577 Transcript_142518/m.455577 type:complete len:204 (+) Transcript_142518:406-1017(+)